MINEKIAARGEVQITVFDEFGNVRETQTHNMILNTGLAFIAGRMLTAGLPTAMSHMAVGTGATAAAKTQTTLVTEVARVALSTSTNVTTTVTNDSVQYTATFPAGTGTGAIVEAGLFNAASAGTMLARTVFGVMTKGANDTLAFTWKIIFV